jgi:hypothetical protein
MRFLVGIFRTINAPGRPVGRPGFRADPGTPEHALLFDAVDLERSRRLPDIC